ncbi:hypothetical protein V8F20_004417 [Naviculisporaceae sp. PSN 640]
MVNSLLPAAALILAALIKPVLSECRPISYTYCEPDRIVHYYDPDTGEICPNMDCGGGRAPPKTDKPGCPFYKGTELPKTEKSYLQCWTPSTSAVTTTVPILTSIGDIETGTSTILGPLPTTVSPGSTQPGGESSSTSTTSGGSAPETTTPPNVSGPPPAQGTQSSTTPTSTAANSGNTFVPSGFVIKLALVGGIFRILL